MLTREQILEVDTYCAEHNITQQQGLEELQIRRDQYYRWKKKYRDEDESNQGPEAFLCYLFRIIDLLLQPGCPQATTRFFVVFVASICGDKNLYLYL